MLKKHFPGNATAFTDNYNNLLINERNTSDLKQSSANEKYLRQYHRRFCRDWHL
jgi:hypothetical protein